MKLKNKKTGEIGNLKPYGGDGRIWVWIDDMSKPEYRYNSLAELNDEWEDAPEGPRDFYIVEQRGMVGLRFRTGDGYEEKFKQIGNYFLSKEEAEMAVRKLEAFKRLKDEGLRFDDWHYRNCSISGIAIGINASFDASKMDILHSNYIEDLTTCFGEML